MDNITVMLNYKGLKKVCCLMTLDLLPNNFIESTAVPPALLRDANISIDMVIDSTSSQGQPYAESLPEEKVNCSHLKQLPAAWQTQDATAEQISIVAMFGNFSFMKPTWN